MYGKSVASSADLKSMLLASFVGPVQIFNYPNDTERKKPSKKSGKTAILTSSPFKNSLVPLLEKPAMSMEPFLKILKTVNLLIQKMKNVL